MRCEPVEQGLRSGHHIVRAPALGFDGQHARQYGHQQVAAGHEMTNSDVKNQQ